MHSLKENMNEYDMLTNSNALGFYNSCEITHCFILDKVTKKVFNGYSIFVFEERESLIEQSYNLTSSLIRISDRFSMGCHRRIIHIDNIKEYYRALMNAKNEVDIGSGILSIGKLEKVNKIFIQQDSTKEIIMNKVLKNNFNNGSYILEFFDIEKPLLQVMTKKEIHKFTTELWNILPVDLFTVTDRIGNFIFQFPSQNVNFTYTTDKSEEKLTYTFDIDHRIKDYSIFELIAEYEYDDNAIGFGMKKKISEVSFELTIGDTSHLCRTTLIDTSNNIIISRQDTAFMRKMYTRLQIGAEFGNKRTILDSTFGLCKEVDVHTGEKIEVNEPIIRHREDYIESRQYKLRMEQLEKRKEFLQYGIDGRNERDRALEDIRVLMNRSEGNMVYLWDPYLTAQDLLDTWYYTECYGTKLKAITSEKIAKAEKCDLKDWMKNQQNILLNRSNNYGIDVEFRCRQDIHGHGFHDRFFMIVYNDKPAQVWSLGTSVNSIGRTHHIIQLVMHPQPVVDAFEAMWSEMNTDDCLIWKS